MKEILFRGRLSVNNGTLHKNDWVYGDYVRLYDGDKTTKHFIYGFGEIDTNTLGQFIGLTDKNEKKIFIGDIVELFCKGSREHKRYEVFYDVETGQLLMRNGNDVEQMYGQLARNDLTVVGNIYDNPELLEEENGDID